MMLSQCPSQGSWIILMVNKVNINVPLVWIICQQQRDVPVRAFLIRHAASFVSEAPKSMKFQRSPLSCALLHG